MPKNLPDNHPQSGHGAADFSDGAADLATAADVVAAETSNYQKILLLILVGGFFVFSLAALLGGFWKNDRSALYGIPNNALGAISIVSNHQAIVVLDNPFEIGRIISLSDSQSLTELALSMPSGTIRSIGRGLVAVGSDSFTLRVAKAPKIPWWIVSRAEFRLRKHLGVFLWSPSAKSPWQFGEIDEIEGQLRLTTVADHGTFEKDLGQILSELSARLEPSEVSLRLPDGTITKELRADPLALTSPIFSYKQTGDDCYAISGLSFPLVLCFKDGDNL